MDSFRTAQGRQFYNLGGPIRDHSRGTGIFFQTGMTQVMDEIAIMTATNGGKLTLSPQLLNPYGPQDDFGSHNGTDAQASATVGGFNPPPLSDHSGLPTGKGTAMSDMTDPHQNNNKGDHQPPDAGKFGKPNDDHKKNNNKKDDNKDCGAKRK